MRAQEREKTASFPGMAVVSLARCGLFSRVFKLFSFPAPQAYTAQKFGDDLEKVKRAAGAALCFHKGKIARIIE